MPLLAPDGRLTPLADILVFGMRTLDIRIRLKTNGNLNYHYLSEMSFIMTKSIMTLDPSVQYRPVLYTISLGGHAFYENARRP